MSDLSQRFPYSLPEDAHDELDRLPRLPLTLHSGERTVSAMGLVDSGATINVLPYHLGLQLGAVWDEGQATIHLAGNLARSAAQPLVLYAKVADFDPVRLAFAWTQATGIPLILGQMNFFMVFNVCFYRAESAFELMLRV